MGKYQIIEHLADLKIKAFGGTKGELFLNMLLGMEESLKPEAKKERVKRKLKVESVDLPALLVDFLNDVLYLIQAKKEIYQDVKFKKFDNTELEAELIGRKAERFGEDIKAATYHGLEIKQKDDGTWEATVLFDI